MTELSRVFHLIARHVLQISKYLLSDLQFQQLNVKNRMANIIDIHLNTWDLWWVLLKRNFQWVISTTFNPFW